MRGARVAVVEFWHEECPGNHRRWINAEYNDHNKAALLEKMKHA